MIITTIVGIYLHEITEQGSNRVDLLVYRYYLYIYLRPKRKFWTWVIELRFLDSFICRENYQKKKKKRNDR